TPPEEYGTDIPTATAAGTYYVWCKVQGDEDHTDSSPVCVTVEINESGSGDTDSGGSGSSSSGCDTGFAGVALLALAGLGALKRRQGKR
ncbi:MAG: SYNERG-CTERM sorting domain-containing protein, partial [Synergistaceae bacterium]|nr:SYNERG-CTERM sorting domain-containing protein [Synergistaceae bacterium]